MGMDVCRFVEVYTPDYDGTCDEKDIKKIGKLEVGDVVLVYMNKDNHHYYRITSIIGGQFYYEVIEEPKDLNEAMKFIDSLDIAWRCETFNDLPSSNVILKEGMIYKYWSSGEQYIQYTNGEWKHIDSCPYSWKQVKWNENNYIASGCSDFICKYIYKGWEGEGKFSGRGLPKDITDDVKNSICDTDFGFTYVSLAEIDDCSNEIRENVKAQLKKAIINEKNNVIDNKLNNILHTLNNEPLETLDETDEDTYYDSFDYVFDEMIPDIEIVNREYCVIDSLVDEIYGHYVPDDKIRIIYSFNN